MSDLSFFAKNSSVVVVGRQRGIYTAYCLEERKVKEMNAIVNRKVCDKKY